MTELCKQNQRAQTHLLIMNRQHNNKQCGDGSTSGRTMRRRPKTSGPNLGDAVSINFVSTYTLLLQHRRGHGETAREVFVSSKNVVLQAAKHFFSRYSGGRAAVQAIFSSTR